MKWSKKLVSLILACVLLASTFAAYAASSETAAEDPLKDHMEITISMWDIPEDLDVEKDYFFSKLCTDMNVTIKILPVTWDDYVQKFQLWATSGELPDVFATDAIGTNFYRSWVNQGIVRAIPQDLSKYPNMVTYMNKPDFEALREPDGNMYCIPRAKYDDIKYCAHDRMVVYRWDLAQAAGITKEPETWDEFEAMLAAIVAKDPDNKNITGITAVNVKQIGGLFWMYSNPAATSDGSGSDFKWIKEDGRYVPAVFSKNALPSLENARKMYANGIIDPDIALLKGTQGMDKFVQGTAAGLLLVGYNNYNKLVNEWKKAYPDDTAEPTERFKTMNYYPSTDGERYHCVFKTYWSESYFNANVDDAKMDRILRIYNYLLSDEAVYTSKFGELGVDYTVTDGKVTLLKPIEEILLKTRGEVLGQLCSYNESFYYTDNNLNWNPEILKIAQDNLKYVQENIKTPSYEPRLTYISTPAKDKMSILDHEDILRIMLGKEPVEKMWQDTLNSYEEKGMSKMIEEVNAKAQEMGIN